jgi:hypothetical protein
MEHQDQLLIQDILQEVEVDLQMLVLDLQLVRADLEGVVKLALNQVELQLAVSGTANTGGGGGGGNDGVSWRSWRKSGIVLIRYKYQ